MFTHGLLRAEGIEVSVVNPKAIKRFAQAACNAAKRMPWMPGAYSRSCSVWTSGRGGPPGAEVMELQPITRRVVQLNKELPREHNRHLAAKTLGVRGRVVANDTAVNVRHLERRMALMQAEAVSRAEADPGTE